MNWMIEKEATETDNAQNREEFVAGFLDLPLDGQISEDVLGVNWPVADWLERSAYNGYLI